MVFWGFRKRPDLMTENNTHHQKHYPLPSRCPYCNLEHRVFAINGMLDNCIEEITLHVKLLEEAANGVKR